MLEMVKGNCVTRSFELPWLVRCHGGCPGSALQCQINLLWCKLLIELESNL